MRLESLVMPRERTYAQQPPPPPQYAAPPPQPTYRAPCPQGGYRTTPTPKEMKLSIRTFDGKELYEGLGANFFDWGKAFLRQMELAESASQMHWPENVKLDCLCLHLGGSAEKYFCKMAESWWNQEATLFYAMNRMLEVYRTSIASSQAVQLFLAPKDPKRSWAEHYMYLVAVSEAAGGKDDMVVENIVKYASPSLRSVLMSRYNPRRFDFLAHAEELIQFAHMMDGPKKVSGKDIVNYVGGGGGATKAIRCYNCNEEGHISRECSQPKKPRGSRGGKGGGGRGGGKDKGDAQKGARFALAVGANGDNGLPDDAWIVDSGASCHLVCDKALIRNPIGHASDCVMPNGERLDVVLKGTVVLHVVVDGAVHELELSDVLYSPILLQNILSYGLIEERGCVLQYARGERFLMHVASGAKVCDVDKQNGVLVIRTVPAKIDPNEMSAFVCAAVATATAPATDAQQDEAQHGTLMHFHARFGHLAYDTIERIARNPESGIVLTDNVRKNCLTCAEGKQTKKDTGDNSPIDRIGGVICSDLKGPMTPLDRQLNRYLVNFVDHKTNYCRMFLAKTKNAAAKQFEHFLVFFEKRFDCRVHVLRTDGGGGGGTRLSTFSASARVWRVRSVKRATKPRMARPSACTARS